MIWGIAFYFQKTAMLHIGPLLFLGLRSVTAALALLPFALREQRRRATGTQSIVPIAILGGLIFSLAGAMQQFGIVTATVINTGLLTALYVVVTPFAFWLIEGRAPAGLVWLSVALSFGGVWALGGGSLGSLSTGDVLIALASLLWGLLIVVTGRSSRQAQPLTYTLIQFAVTAGVCLTLAAALEPISLIAIRDAAASILYVGLLSSALTFGLMATALQYVPAPRVSVMLSVEVLFATAAGYILLGERLTPLGWLGAAAIISAVLIVRLRDRG